LRQPTKVSREEKLHYVDEVIELLDMELYADAVVGIPGEGLNVEQRKRLTIGVELAAKPQLLLFLDESNSGLDSQTSWIICNLMKKLKNNGQQFCAPFINCQLCSSNVLTICYSLRRAAGLPIYGEIGNDSKILQAILNETVLHNVHQ
jgi:ATP-binding cassette subfamily G (WHITE) protein 2 (PDR)